MSARSTTLLAWSMATLAIVFTGLGLLFTALGPTNDVGMEQSSPVDVVLGLCTPLGALIASRRPRNPIGWLFCAVGVDSGLTILALEYGLYGLRHPSGVPGAQYVYGVGTWIGVIGFLLGVWLFLLFPDGRFLSRHWKGVLFAAAAATVVFAVAEALSPWPGRVSPPAANPFAIGDAAPLLATIRDAAFMALAVCFAASTVAVGLRLRRSAGDERQQLKWFAYAATIAAAATIIVAIDERTGSLLTPLAYGLVYVATAVAILKYRLYDIDSIISRTLVYGLLTGILGGIYVVLVVLFQFVLNPVTGESSLAIAASTLVVASLFRRVRTHIQSLIARRFYRARYDATLTIESFSRRLARETDLDALNVELVKAIQNTVQPASVSLWLRPPLREPRVARPHGSRETN